MTHTTNTAVPAVPALLGKKPSPLYTHPLRIFWRGKFPLDMLRRLRLLPRTESDSRAMIRSLDSELTDGHSADFVKFHAAHAPSLFADDWDPTDAVEARALLWRDSKITRIDLLDYAGNILRAWEFEPADPNDATQVLDHSEIFAGDTQKVPST